MIAPSGGLSPAFISGGSGVSCVLSHRMREAGDGLNRKPGVFAAIAARICRSGDTSSRIQKPLP